YYFYSGSALVPAIGASASFYFHPTLSGASSSVELGLAPNVSLYYFIKDRISPYISLYPSFNSRLYSGGSQSFAESLSFNFRTTIGISFWLPNKEKVLFQKAGE
ncbi:MAG: hypothetical protein AB1798_11285, partial [Spirochaetota bacterium]